MTLLTPLLCLLLLLPALGVPYNSSLCADVEMGELHFFINANHNNQDISYRSGNATITYNLCRRVEVYCQSLNAVVADSLVSVNSVNGSCLIYTQSSVEYLDSSNVSKGIRAVYSSSNPNITAITMDYPCQVDSQIGCPSVQSGIMWEYFNRHVLTYTIIIEIVGCILMVLGIYIYRGSIVLIGWGTAFIILIMIQSLFVFLRGVPDTLIENVLILTVICSFFVGYLLGWFPKAGVFCMGLWIGFVITLTLNNIAFYYISSNPSNLVLYIVLPVLSVSFGLIILCIKRTFIIFASSLIGSYLCLRALSWHLGAFPNEFQLAKKYHLGLSPQVPWQFYLYVIALLILTASSSALQTWLFKKKMRKTQGDSDLEHHLDQMETSLKKERDHLIEFQTVFQPDRSQPRLLTRNKNPHSKETSLKEVSEEEEEYGSERHSEPSLPPYIETEEEHFDYEEPKHKTTLQRMLLPGRKSPKN